MINFSSQQDICPRKQRYKSQLRQIHHFENYQEDKTISPIQDQFQHSSDAEQGLKKELSKLNRSYDYSTKSNCLIDQENLRYFKKSAFTQKYKRLSPFSIPEIPAQSLTKNSRQVINLLLLASQKKLHNTSQISISIHDPCNNMPQESRSINLPSSGSKQNNVFPKFSENNQLANLASELNNDINIQNINKESCTISLKGPLQNNSILPPPNFLNNQFFQKHRYLLHSIKSPSAKLATVSQQGGKLNAKSQAKKELKHEENQEKLVLKYEYKYNQTPVKCDITVDKTTLEMQQLLLQQILSTSNVYEKEEAKYNQEFSQLMQQQSQSTIELLSRLNKATLTSMKEISPQTQQQNNEKLIEAFTNYLKRVKQLKIKHNHLYKFSSPSI